MFEVGDSVLLINRNNEYIDVPPQGVGVVEMTGREPGRVLVRFLGLTPRLSVAEEDLEPVELSREERDTIDSQERYRQK